VGPDPACLARAVEPCRNVATNVVAFALIEGRELIGRNRHAHAVHRLPASSSHIEEGDVDVGSMAALVEVVLVARKGHAVVHGHAPAPPEVMEIGYEPLG